MALLSWSVVGIKRIAQAGASKGRIIAQGPVRDKAHVASSARARGDTEICGMKRADDESTTPNHGIAAHCFVEAPLGPGARIELPRDLAHHLGRVLRLNDGATVSLFDGSGPAWLARLRLSGGGPATADVTAVLDADRESPLRVVLGQGLSSGDRMDITVQKAVELGVAGIAPLATARAVVKLSGDRAERRREHWQRVAIAACEQCKRSVVPVVEPVQGLRQWLAALPNDAPKWLLCARQGQRLADLPRPAAGQPGYLLTGPEGGFTDEERALVVDTGFVAVRLGPRVLRTETAALTALAAMQVVWGDF